MFEKLVLIIALAAQIIYQLARSFVDLVELIALDFCHAAPRVASNASQTVVKLGT